MLTALIIDDEIPSREELKALLATAPDIEVLGECTNAIEGLSAIHRLRPDVVFLDISMPGMSGEEVLARLRADPRLGGLHVIAYTAHALPEEKQRLIDAGFDDLLIKPISLKAVEVALADFLPA